MDATCVVVFIHTIQRSLQTFIHTVEAIKIVFRKWLTLHVKNFKIVIIGASYD
jgi:hypothetical protein